MCIRDRAYTDNDGKYSGVVNLPTAVGKVYVYSESYGFPACIEADVTAGGISCNVRQFYEKAAGKVSGAAVADRVAATRADAANPYNVPVSYTHLIIITTSFTSSRISAANSCKSRCLRSGRKSMEFFIPTKLARFFQKHTARWY